MFSKNKTHHFLIESLGFLRKKFHQKGYVPCNPAEIMVYRHVALGGTFDHFHRGHEALIKKAVELGDFVTIGVTSDRFAGRDCEPYKERKKTVERFLGRLGCNSYSLVKLEDPFGPATTDETLEALVVSEETYGRAVELNQIRREAGLDELKIDNIVMLPAEDGGPLSSSRIRTGEINRMGRLIKKG